MKQYIIHLKVEDYEVLAKEIKGTGNAKGAKQNAVAQLREKSKALVIKQLEPKLKAKEIIHIKNDSPLPFVILGLDETKLDDLVDFLRKLDVVEMIEVDYAVLVK